MATNRHLRHLLLAIIFFCGFAPFPWAPFLGAQSVRYFIDMEGGEPRFFQRLAWIGGEYALRYEVVVEREVNGRNITQLREFTEMPFIEVSLPPGRYRYQVISYNILERVEDVSKWVNIEVRPAVQPEVFYISPEYVLGGNDGEPSGYVINIGGHNIVSGAEFIILYSDGTPFITEVIDSNDGINAAIFIAGVVPGTYEIMVRNPGGLETVMSGIVFPQPQDITLSTPEPEPEDGETTRDPLKPILLFAGAAWAPVFPLHGDFFGKSFSPAGAGARFGAAYPILRGIRLGAELTTFWHIQTDNDDFRNILSAGINLLSMKWLANQIMALGFRMGLSFIILPVIQEKLMFNIGASYLWRFTGKFLLEAGFDYAGRIKENSFDGYIRPWIGAGVIF